MWVDFSVRVGDEQVGLCVQRLEDDERERTAATLAWITLEAITGGADGTLTNWHEFMADVLRQHVTFTVSEERLASLGPSWWHEAVDQALVQFVRQNELAPRINRHIDAMQRIARSDRPQS